MTEDWIETIIIKKYLKTPKFCDPEWSGPKCNIKCPFFISESNSCVPGQLRLRKVFSLEEYGTFKTY